MLDRYPYEAEEVAKADAARTELLRAGFDAIQAVQEQWERARFFQLRKGYEDCAGKAQALLAQYEGSELEAPIRALLEQIDTDLAGFGDPNVQDGGHMDALLEVLSDRGATRLMGALQPKEAGGSQE